MAKQLLIDYDDYHKEVKSAEVKGERQARRELIEGIISDIYNPGSVEWNVEVIGPRGMELIRILKKHSCKLKEDL